MVSPQVCYHHDMKLIVGLGNPGVEYEQTRHNVGFFVVDSLKLKVDSENKLFAISQKHKALIYKSNNFILAKPQTFMNGSGEAVSSLCRFYRIAMDQLYVIHDDLDIALGEYKIQFGKGPKIHNGINSVIAALRTDQFWRVRMGVEKRVKGEKVQGKNYLLSAFASEEKALFSEVMQKVVEELTHVL